MPRPSMLDWRIRSRLAGRTAKRPKVSGSVAEKTIAHGYSHRNALARAARRPALAQARGSAGAICPTRATGFAPRATTEKYARSASLANWFACRPICARFCGARATSRAVGTPTRATTQTRRCRRHPGPVPAAWRERCAAASADLAPVTAPALGGRQAGHLAFALFPNSGHPLRPRARRVLPTRYVTSLVQLLALYFVFPPPINPKQNSMGSACMCPHAPKRAPRFLEG